MQGDGSLKDVNASRYVSLMRESFVLEKDLEWKRQPDVCSNPSGETPEANKNGLRDHRRLHYTVSVGTVETQEFCEFILGPTPTAHLNRAMWELLAFNGSAPALSVWVIQLFSKLTGACHVVPS